MAMSTDADGSEDVNDFLLRIKELGDQRDREDEERTRKLEEEIIQGRRERQARRAERARSLSPTKETSSNAGTPGSAHSRKDMSTQEDLSRTPSFQTPSRDRANFDDAPQKVKGASSKDDSPGFDIKPRELPQPPSKPQALSGTPPSAALPLARAGTLSWQQRPASRVSTGPRTRPLSTLVSVDSATKSPRASIEPSNPTDVSLSRDQIAQSLGARDPSWFKQTQDRGSGSAAYRRNQVEDISDNTSSTGSTRLPGMSRESTAEPEDGRSPPTESTPSDSTSRHGSIRGNPGVYNYSSSASISSSSSMRSPLPTMSSQRFEPPSSDTTSTLGIEDNSSTGRTLAMSPSQGRISPERMDRPSSPTKGLGGFVQSAMLKRSDSVNKRWSAQAGPGLSRGNSTASNLSGYGSVRYPMGGITPLMESRPSSFSREGSPRPSSRPTSSHSSTAVTQNIGDDDRPATSTSLSGSVSASRSEGSFPNAIIRESRSLAPAEEMKSPPASPNKKWSPTKSSWLENALNKPDSPKIRLPAPQQPAWMSEINRVKQQRGSVDLGKGGSNFKEVSIGGLVRSPPPGAGYKPPTIGGFPSGFSAGVATKSRNGSVDDATQRSDSPGITKANGNVATESSNEASRADESIDRTHIAQDKSDTPAVSKTTASPTTTKITSQSPAISPAATKTKPETPPKRDFRPPLKSRQRHEEKNTREEPDFKNVFGNLKRTQTKNYVAPDEFKDTILRGKTGLAQTGGPRKTERKDDFKESILQKKQGMVLPSASTRITSASSRTPEQSTPEAIAKRKGLLRSESIQSVGSTEEEKQASKPEALTKLAHLRDKPKSGSPEKQYSAPATIVKDSGPKNGLGDDFASSLAGILQHGPSPIAIKPTTEILDGNSDGRLSETARESNVPSDAPQLTHVTKARARGPKRRLPTASKQQESAISPRTQPASQPALRDMISLAEKLPRVTATSPKPRASSQSPSKPEPRPLSNITHNNNINGKSSQPLSPRKPSTHIAPSLTTNPVSNTAEIDNEEGQLKPSPHVKQKVVTNQPDENIHQPSTSTLAADFDTALKRVPTQEPQPPPPSLRRPEKHDIKANDEDPALPSVKGVAATWGQAAKPSPSSRARSPVKLPTRKDEDAAMEETPLKAKDPITLATKTSAKEALRSAKRDQSPAAHLPRSPPLPGKKPSSIASRVPSASLPPPVAAQRSSPTTKPSQISAFFADIFDEPPSSKSKMTIDTQAVLDSRSSTNSSQKIKTLRKRIFEVSENGQSVPVPSHAEHILFGESLYICTHVFGTLTGQRTTEVYLWCGDGVPSATVEDAQVFAKKTAKENNGKLIILKQGKETANFFQALGGIVVTRRGSANTADAPVGAETKYMLCGRQHVGQIAFDEVDFSPRSLCQGFPYIVSAPGGKLYLWKGSGSGADELGCARLIGMDLGLTGEIEELDEGREPDAFWRCFQDGKRDFVREAASSGQHWHLKPSCEKYTTRLFSIGTPRPKSGSGPIQGAMQWVRRGSAPASDANTSSTAHIREVMPFTQSDLSDDGVFVLDAFFEIFVIMTLRSLAPAPHQKSAESSAFRAALLFAQEYGILAASAEDRPFVPASSVVVCSRNTSGAQEVDTIPEGLVRAFRKWDAGSAKECRVIPLTAALEAMGETR